MIIFCLLIVPSCQDDDIDTPNYEEHFVLIYMIADNDLYRYAEQNIKDIQSAWSDKYNGKVIVFIDPPNRSG